MRPDISIIIPVYNVEQYIEDAIKSVQAQSKTDFEVIIVDDGSKDGSVGIVKRLTQGDDRFRYVSQKNSGLGAARMTGLRHAKADYITFLDSDDRLRTDALEALYDGVEQSGADIVSGRFERISEEGEPDNVVTDRLAQHELPKSVKSLEPWQAVLGAFAPSISCARLYSRKLLEGIDPLFPPRLPHEDLFFTYKALFQSKRHHAIDKIVYQYRQRDGSLSKGVSKDHVESFFAQIDDTNRYFRDDSEHYAHAAPLAARRTLIMLHGIRTRVKNADEEVRGYFSKKIERRYPELIRQLDTFQKSFIKDAFIPPQSVKYLEDVQRNMKSKIENNKSTNKTESAADRSILHTYKKRESVPITSDDRKQLRDFYNRFRGKRAFIVGNGPALNKHDLSLLDGEYVFGVNSIFLKSRESDFKPTFYVVEDSKVYEENADDIAAYDVPFKFFPVDYREKYGAVPGAHYFQMNQGFYLTNSPNHAVPRFSTDMSRELFCGQTVTYLNMQIAFYMGFERIYLIGMDFEYNIPDSHVRKGNHILSTTDDPNHFHKDYFGVGKTWKDPKLDRVAMNYRQAKLAYEAVGRKVFNATIGGKLEIFDRVDYETLLRDPDTGRKIRERPPVVITRTVERDMVPAAPAAQQTQAVPIQRPVAAAPSVNPQDASARDHIRAAPPEQAQNATAEEGSSDTGKQAQQNVRRAWYAPVGNAVRTHAPALFPVLQRGRRIIWKLLGSPSVWLAAAGGIAAIGLTLEGPWPMEQRLTLAGAVAGAAGLAALGLIAWRFRRYIANLSAQNHALFSEIQRIHELTKGRDARAEQLSGHQERLRSEIARMEARLTRQTTEQTSRQDQKIRKDLEAVIAELNAGMATLDARHKAMAAEAEQSVEAQLDELHQRMNATLEEQWRWQEQAAEGSQNAEARLDELNQRLESQKEETNGKVKEAMDELNQRLAGMEDKAESGAKALDAARQELEDSMKALRQGLEQRMFAEIDEYTKGATSELIARIDAIEAAQTQGDEAYKAGLEVLKKALDEELKPEVGEVREIAESNAALTKEIHKAVKIGRVERARLHERAVASERQIGALRYPDAPDVFVFFGHHKCASRFFRMEVFQHIAESTGAGIRAYEIKDPPFHYSRMDELDLVNVDFKGLGKDGRDVVLFANASQRGLNKIKRNAKDWKGLRIIRDPRQVLISNYFHHKGDHPDESPLGWIWDQLVKDKPILRELPEEDGILHELDNISKQVIEDQIMAPFDDERVMTIRLEDFSKDPGGHLLQISEFLKVPDVAGINFGNTQANPDSGPWHKHFTSRIREAFKERYGQALIDLGYAEDMDW